MSSEPRTHSIALIPGDGIGVEVMAPARDLLDRVAGRHGFSVQSTEYDWSCQRYLDTGSMMPADGLDRLREHDAILLGAVGYPGVPDHVSLWGLLIPIRRAFDLYVNLRPARIVGTVQSPLREIGDGIDMLIVRENSEGEYSEVGGRLFPGTRREAVLQEAVFTREGIERIVRFAGERARERQGHIISATKSNGIIHSMTYWDEVVTEVLEREFADVPFRSMHVDALAARMVSHPSSIDVVVGSNLFGDILSDLSAAVVGGLGLAPSANLSMDPSVPSMFEPVHGSAPDIAGRGIANPIAQFWSTAMMLEHLGEQAAADDIMAAITTVLSEDGPRTPDLGGTASTADVAAAVLDALPQAAGTLS